MAREEMVEKLICYYCWKVMSMGTREGNTCVLIGDKFNYPKYSCNKCLEKHHPQLYDVFFGDDDENSDLTNGRRKF